MAEGESDSGSGGMLASITSSWRVWAVVLLAVGVKVAVRVRPVVVSSVAFSLRKRGAGNSGFALPGPMIASQ